MKKKFMLLAVLGCLLLASCSKFELGIAKSKSEKGSTDITNKNEQASKEIKSGEATNDTKSEDIKVSKEIRADGMFSIVDGKAAVNIDTTLARKKINELRQAL